MERITRGFVAVAALLAALASAHAAGEPVVKGSFAAQSGVTGSDAPKLAASGSVRSPGGVLQVSTVPETSTYLMMFAGLVAIGLSLSRRRARR